MIYKICKSNLLNLLNIFSWIGIVIKKKIEKEQQLKEQEPKDGILSYFLSWGGVSA